MQDEEIQRVLLKEARTPKKALERPINIEKDIQNQVKISETLAKKVLNQLANPSINSIEKPWNNPRTIVNKFKPKICPICRYTWSPSHCQDCPEREKTAKNLRVANHFAKNCRKTKNPMKPKTGVNNVHNASSETVTARTYATVEEEVNQVYSMLRKDNIYDANYFGDKDDLDDNCVAVISDSDSLTKVEPVNMQIQFGNIKTKYLLIR